MKKYLNRIRLILLHVSLICAVVILTAGILDWFNPYMNFTGHIRPLEIVQTAALLFLALTVKQQSRSKNKENFSRK